MADKVVSVVFGDVKFMAWLRSSYLSLGIVSEDGRLLLDKVELGPDRADAFEDFFEEASREVLKVYSPRQGNLVAADPFTYDGTLAEYSFYEEEPVLPHGDSLIENLDKTTSLAVYTYIMYLWLKHVGLDDKADVMLERYGKFVKDIDVLLYKLHD